MKLKYIIPSLLALFAMAFTSCSDDEALQLGNIQVSKSYVSLPVEGGSATITITAADSWQFDTAELPEWLTLSAPAGAAGETQVTFTGTPALDGRTAVLHVTCGNERQTINIIQGVSEASIATCAEVNEGPESKTYRVTGTVASIVNTTYGNWYLRDETGEVYIYGTLDANGGTKNFLSLGLEVGDVVTVEGPKTIYNGTTELVDVTVIDIQKSLVKVDRCEPADGTFPVQGGVVAVSLMCKTGLGVSVDIPDEAKEWLSVLTITYGEYPAVVFQARPNEGGDRSATVVFKSALPGGKVYSAETTLHQKGAIVECSIAEFLEAPVSSTQYRLTGVITEVANASYGNVYITDWSGKAYVYGIGSKGDFEAAGLKVGDIVTLVGARGAYNNSPQMTGAQLESFKPVTAISLSDFLDQPDSPDVYYMLTGDIDEIANPTYGNLYINDGDERVYIYGCYPGWGATGDNRKNLLENLGITLGDRLSVIGTKTTYNGTVELQNGIYFSHTKASQSKRR